MVLESEDAFQAALEIPDTLSINPATDCSSPALKTSLLLFPLASYLLWFQAEAWEAFFSADTQNQADLKQEMKCRAL